MPAGKETSFIHRLDPRTKLILTLVFSALVFAVGSLPVAAGQMLFFAGLAVSAGIPFKKMFPHAGLLAAMIAMVIVMQMLLRPVPCGSSYILFPEWFPVLGGRGALGLDGFLFGLTIACRIVALAVLMPLLTITTDARLLAFGMTKLGANYRVAHVITSTLNLVRSFEDEIRLIMDARRLRGAALAKTANVFASFFFRLAEYRAIALPLMIKVMRRSASIALVMDSRAFGAHKTRTWLLSVKMTSADYAAFAVGLAYLAAVVAADRILAGDLLGG